MSGRLTPEMCQRIEESLENVEGEIRMIRSLLRTVRPEALVIKHKTRRRMRAWVTNNVLLFTVLWQLLLLSIISALEFFLKDLAAVLDVAIVLGSLTQLVQMVFIIATSVKLAKQLQHRTASGWFLIQSYLAVIINFAGVYTLMFQINPKSFYCPTINKDSEIFIIYGVFLYFSGNTISTVGYGDIYPVVWYTELWVFLEAMLSVVFSTVIFVKVGFLAPCRKPDFHHHWCLGIASLWWQFGRASASQRAERGSPPRLHDYQLKRSLIETVVCFALGG
jgi:potassium channel LctB